MIAFLLLSMGQSPAADFSAFPPVEKPAVFGAFPAAQVPTAPEIPGLRPVRFDASLGWVYERVQEPARPFAPSPAALTPGSSTQGTLVRNADVRSTSSAATAGVVYTRTLAPQVIRGGTNCPT